ncbi:MAG: TIGR03668 family PPOX class F420-dependent oxidoreductase [Candidatus Rokubacteria bacterium]|nr:TIGR03668 family PPOX class F420-dependent oxidoreductase [Candidatus Rokubacteria bacterium]
MALAAPLAALPAQSRVARLATLDDTGHPHVVPVCYATDGRAYYSAIDAKPKRTPADRLKRVRNIRANRRVALLFDHYEEDWRQLRWVLVQGQAELLSAGPEWEAARDLLEAKYPQYATLPLPEGGLMIKITPERVIAWSAAE